MVQIEGPWRPEEDNLLQNLAAVFGMYWSLISKSIPGRTVKSCWSRWISLCWLFMPQEDEMLENLVEKHGLNWSLISRSMSGKSDMSCRTRWHSLTGKGVSLPNEDITIDAHEISPQSVSSYIHDGNLSHEAERVSGKAPSIGDMPRCDMSLECIHSFARDNSTPSWNAVNKRDLSLLMIRSDNV